MWRDMRSFMEFLENRKDLVRIKKEVDLKYEISAVLRKMGKREMPVALFENVKERSMPVVGNLYATSKRVCQALGVPKDKIWLEYLSTIHDTENPVPGMIQSARSNPIPHKEVKDGPVKEVIKKGSEIDLTELSIPTWFEHDGGPFISGAVGIAWNTKTKLFNTGIYRTQLLDKNTLAINATPGHDLHNIFLEAEERKESFDIALVVGPSPAVYISATDCGGTGLSDVPELGIAGALMGEPLEVVKCETLDLVVPANAEMIIEGKVDLDTKFMEGPITEALGYYTGRLIPVTKVTAICHRSNPIFHVVLPGHTPGHGATQAMCRPSLAMRILKALQSRFPNVKAVAMSGWIANHLILSMDKKKKGEPAEVIRTAFDMNINERPLSLMIRRITVVDAWDIDIRDRDEVEWAINNNIQDESRIIVIPNVKNSPMARTSLPDGTSARLGIDATAPLIVKDPPGRIILKKGEGKSKAIPYVSWVPESLKLKHGTVPGIGDIDLDDYLT